MARRYVGYTSRGPSAFHNVRREAGYPLVLMEDGETVKLALDFSSMLESGETISSVAAAGSGVTVSANTSGSTATLTISAPGAWGEITVTITLSSGEIIVETIRARLNSRPGVAETAYAI